MFFHCIRLCNITACSIKRQYKKLNSSVNVESTYLISRCFFMITQTRQFPTTSTTTSKECTVAMAMPDDSSMTEGCRRSNALGRPPK